MNDQMTPLPFLAMLKELLEEYPGKKSFFGVPVQRGNREFVSPLGPAAGPHTQLAPNLVAAFGAGASFFELKTVQIMEGEALGLQKPCIYTGKEVYNTEWSTELTVEQAAAEYLKSYWLIHLLSMEFSLAKPQHLVYLPSIGYNLEGLKSRKINGFLEVMADGRKAEIWQEMKRDTLENLHLFHHVTKQQVEKIPTRIADTVTLSTMHGCRKEEIFDMARYLMEDKGFHTYIKLNPTLLGRERVREILDAMGYYQVVLEETSFQEDLTLEEAVDMLEKLLQTGQNCGCRFGVKLTNTLPVRIVEGELPGQTMYMSGPPLYPLAVGVGACLGGHFGNRLPMSYSGGADPDNVSALTACGFYPVTISSALLKPGGYRTLSRMNDRIPESYKTLGYAEKTEKILPKVLAALAKTVLQEETYRYRKGPSFPPKEPYSPVCAKCRNCVDVCPNRANRKLTEGGVEKVYKIEELCNACGNCACFCVMGHRPYMEKTGLSYAEYLKKTENEKEIS